jgi:hypothetical protein
VQAREQTLRNHCLQIEREVQQNLRVRRLRKEIEDALNRLAGVVGMQGGNTQMAGFGVMHCVLHGLAVANFADHDHAGRFAHGVAQGFVVRQGIESHLSLGHQGALVRMHILDGILDGENVTRNARVAVVEQSGQRGGFAGACGAHGQYQSTLEKGELLHRRGQAQGFNGSDVRRNIAHHHAGLSPLHVQVDTKAPCPWHLQSQVAFLAGFKHLRLRCTRHRRSKGLDIRPRQNGLLKRQIFPMAAHRRRCSCDQEQVGSLLADHGGQQVEQNCISRPRRAMQGLLPVATHQALTTSSVTAWA